MDISEKKEEKKASEEKISGRWLAEISYNKKRPPPSFWHSIIDAKHDMAERKRKEK